MALRINNNNALDFFVNYTPVERGYLNGVLFWERKLDLWLSTFLPPGQGTWYGYFDIDSQVQARAPGFKGDVIFHIDCPVVSTNVEYPIDVGPYAAGRGYRSFVVRVEPNGRIYGYGGYGGAGGQSTKEWPSGSHGDRPQYGYPQDGYVKSGEVRNSGRAGMKGGDGGGCINARGYAIVQMPNAWRNYLLAGGGGGGGGAKLRSRVYYPGGSQQAVQLSAGGGGGIGFNNAPGGGGDRGGGGANSGTFGVGAQGNSGYQDVPPNPHIAGYGGNSVNYGENQYAPSNGGNGGSWNQGGGGGAMSLKLWTNWGWEGHFKGRDGQVAGSPTDPGWGGAPGSFGSSHDYRQSWSDGGFGGRSGIAVVSPRAIHYY